MKFWLRHIVITLNLLVFLFSISGFTIYRHECLKSGIVHVSWAQITDCCEKKEEVKPKPKCCKEKEEHREKKKCCTDSKFSKQLKTDYSFSSHKVLPDFFVWITPGFTYPSLTANPSHAFFSYTDPSPPLSGRSILIKKQSFLI